MEKPHILILAAGQGKRMQSTRPKVLHPVLYRPMIHHVIDLAMSLPHASISLVVGNGEQQVREACAHYKEINYVVQAERKGTGHAVQMAEGFLKSRGGTTLILSGDVILLRKQTLEELLAAHEKTKSTVTLLSAEFEDPAHYGRIIKDGTHNILAIREAADCTDEQKKIREINAGVYLFDTAALFAALTKTKSDNKQGEYYLTDTIEILAREGKKVTSLLLNDAQEIEGINDRHALNKVQSILQNRVNNHWIDNGVTISHPDTVFIDPHTMLGKDITLEPNVKIIGSHIADGVTIESDTRVLYSEIGEGSYIRQGCYIEKSKIGKACSVGPFAHLRPASELSDEVKIGNYVEIKKSRIGHRSKASHLSYIGDAEIGANVNLGCGFITCNYDGDQKHVTVIEDNVFVGSDSQTVAPVTIGSQSYVASGTTVTEDVPEGSLVLSRGRQITKTGYVSKIKKK